MSAVYRRDVGEMRPPRRLPNGSLVFDAVISRAGVFEYRRADGSIRREYRPPEEVFHRDSLASFHFAPVTDKHPPVAVDTRNAREFSRGSVGGQVRQDGNFVIAELSVTDATLIEAIEAGQNEVSSGYMVQLEETPGITPAGERFDAIQRRIRGNHVAIVNEGRAGPDVRLRTDEAVQVAQVAGSDPSCYPEDQMTADVSKILSDRLDKAEAELKEEAKRADAAEARADAAESALAKTEAERDAEKKRADEAEAQRDAATARADAAEDPEKFRAAARARLELEAKVEKIMADDSYKCDGKDDKTLRLDALKKLGIELPEDKSEDYVTARFDAEDGRYANADSALHQTIVNDDEHRYDTRPAPKSIEVLQKEHRQREQNRWRKPKASN